MKKRTMEKSLFILERVHIFLTRVDLIGTFQRKVHYEDKHMVCNEQLKYYIIIILKNSYLNLQI